VFACGNLRDESEVNMQSRKFLPTVTMFLFASPLFLGACDEKKDDAKDKPAAAIKDGDKAKPEAEKPAPPKAEPAAPVPGADTGAEKAGDEPADGAPGEPGEPDEPAK
jgi:hypothetical protein